MRKISTVAIVAMCLTIAPAYAAFDPNRIVTAVDHGTGTFSCRAGAGEATYTYKTTAKTVVRVSRARVKLRYLWNRGALSDIGVGNVVTVQYHLSGSDRIADRVVIYPKR